MNSIIKELNINDISPGKSHLIEANAGTGKTYAIANLFLRFILEGSTIQNLLVVTFTRAATDELRGRIRKRVNQARLLLTANAEAIDEDDFFTALPKNYPEGKIRDQAIQRLALALLDIHEAPIYTIHGFCQQALSDQAFSSGQSFELEQADDEELKRKAMQDWWRKRTYEMNQDALSAFNEIFATFDSFCDFLTPLLKAPAPDLLPMPADDIISAELKTLAELWQKHGKDAQELLLTHKALSRTKTNGQQLETLEPILHELDELLSQTPPKLPEANKLARIAHTKISLKPKGRDKTDFDREPFYQAASLLTILEPLKYKPLITELGNARDYVTHQISSIKQRQGLLSFDDMIQQLHNGLHDAPAKIELAERLATQYPIILVDEFQDTDILQYAIFNRIHAAGKNHNHTFIMIGDPKQAIYGFRGGDIFTYMRARREAEQHWSLSTNWRSTPEMIDAVNQLFDGENSFTYDDIPYEPSRPAPVNKLKAQPLTINAKAEPALIIQKLPRKEDGKASSKGDIYNHVHHAVAQRIAELLSDENACIGDKPLQPADIAILVSSGFEAKEVRQALLEQGVRAVSVGKDNIWKSDEAIGLRYLLEAAQFPDNRNLLRQALTAPFLNLNAEDLLSIITTPRCWSNWVELIHKTSTQWQQRGFMPAFQTLLGGFSLVLNPTSKDTDTPPTATDWLKRISDPERCLTNLFHLAELLQQASKKHPSGEQLLSWMYQQENTEDNEDHQLRLESDEELVKIVTMHASKGLEFPIVFAAYLWHCKPADHNVRKSTSWHEESNGTFQHYYSPWIDKSSAEFKLADHERLAEDIRLSYVALTRASAHCHVFFDAAGSRTGHAGHTALAWLLSDRKLDLEHKYFVTKATDISLQSLQKKPNISILPAQENLTSKVLNKETISSDALDVEHIERKIRSNWQIGSYSAMTRNVHQTTRVSSQVKTDDYALNFEAGAHVGNFLHTLLEHIDPTQDLLPQINKLTPSLTLRFGLKQKPETEDLTGWMHNVLHTPLNKQGMTLAGLDREHTRHELEFDLSANNVQCNKLNTLLREQSSHELPPLDFKKFQGMITGIIDLVFEHEGKYYIADYKSNLLGRKFEDYSLENLSIDISARRYDLQYLIYTLALHRHLKQRLKNYSYERDFGGVYYLFLRAMHPKSATDYGVYFTCPDARLIEKLDNEIFNYQMKEIA
jgi:exodeoxyribonuclease V beta subunit